VANGEGVRTFPFAGGRSLGSACLETREVVSVSARGKAYPRHLKTFWRFSFSSPPSCASGALFLWIENAVQPRLGSRHEGAPADERGEDITTSQHLKVGLLLFAVKNYSNETGATREILVTGCNRDGVPLSCAASQ
jgi:hypothetical protein